MNPLIATQLIQVGYISDVGVACDVVDHLVQIVVVIDLTGCLFHPMNALHFVIQAYGSCRKRFPVRVVKILEDSSSLSAQRLLHR